MRQRSEGPAAAAVRKWRHGIGLPYVLAIVPTVGVGVLFYFVIKSILEGDRRERLAQARWEAEHDRAVRAGPPNPASPQARHPSVTPTTRALSQFAAPGTRQGADFLVIPAHVVMARSLPVIFADASRHISLSIGAIAFEGNALRALWR